MTLKQRLGHMGGNVAAPQHCLCARKPISTEARNISPTGTFYYEDPEEQNLQRKVLYSQYVTIFFQNFFVSVKTMDIRFQSGYPVLSVARYPAESLYR